MKVIVAVLALAVGGQAAPDYTQKRLDKAVAYWQHALRLDDYQIYVKFAGRGPEEVPEDAYAVTQVNYDRMVVWTLVLNPSDYQTETSSTDEETERHTELAVVHELMHVRLYVMATALDKALKTAFETAKDDDAKEEIYKTHQKAEEIEEHIVVRVSEALLAEHSRGDEHVHFTTTCEVINCGNLTFIWGKAQ